MDFSVNTRPLLQDSDSDNDDLTTQSYEESVVIKDDKPLFRPPAPRDKFNMAYLIFYLLGITTLLPWNFFVTADNYWMYKFRDTHSNSTKLHNLNKRTTLQAEFTSYLSVSSSVPNVIFLIVNTALNQRISLQKRVVGSLVIILLLFILTTIFVQIDTDDCQQSFFIVTLTTLVVLNICSAILSGSIFGVMGKFSSKYITATIGGQALGGIFAALAEIAALALGASSVHSAFVYFMVANIMVLMTLVSYVFLSKTVFFKYHIHEKVGLTLSEFQSELVRPRIIDHRVIIKKIWPYGFSIFVVFLITLSVYPGVTVLIESENKRSGRAWNNVYFVPCIAYLLFSVGDYVGRLIAGKIQRPRKGISIILLNILRLIFIPLIILCNVQPREHLPVVITSDAYYIGILSMFSLSNGYLANLAVICAPRVVEQHEKETASSIMTVFMGFGLAFGSGISLLIVKLL